MSIVIERIACNITVQQFKQITSSLTSTVNFGISSYSQRFFQQDSSIPEIVIAGAICRPDDLHSLKIVTDIVLILTSSYEFLG